MSGRVQKECDDDSDRVDDAVDPRVQIELERLNTATDDINKLEVDLDEARATFRELLCESTIKIDTLAKKLGACIEKSRPYYDARFKAKEALQETQKAAIRFERANSQHAAAKEMVYLAEEGLRTEGRCFDHAWQEMLNHATSRVNESEHERALSEAEHRHTTALYHKAEHEVQRLQRELKRAIAKSRPYYEMKAHFNQMLEEQKMKVSALERSVGEAKMTYAEALRNLERISDEIHRTRQCDTTDDFGKHMRDSSDHPSMQTNTATPSDSSITGSPDSTDYTSDEYLRLPDRMSPSTPCLVPTKIERDPSSEYLGLNNLNLSTTEPRKYIKRDRPRSIATTDTKHIVQLNHTSSSTSRLSDLSSIISPIEKRVKIQSPVRDEKNNTVTQNGEEWTEISLNNSPDENYYNNDIYSDEEDQIPYKPLPMDLSPENINLPTLPLNTQTLPNEQHNRKRLVSQKSLPSITRTNEVSLSEEKKAEVTRSPSVRSKGKLDNTSLANWITRSSAGGEISGGSSANSSRRQSLDMLWGGGTGERVKELLSHGMMMLNISSLTERRSSEPRTNEKDKEKSDKFEKTESKGKKVPSPLEKTMTYLNADEETSDSESLASVEMLTEDQISSLMMEPDMNQVCQEILGTPLVEVCPLLQQLQQQQ
ncbi:hypothetical protein KPH14_001814 [Odynerus spinipes]|uniref:SH3 domain-binding protein 5-like n=1 Tax=Odynerus spinipes TaxID=1348599 RepID=A0AAD9RZT8_9HYME|nr:hypothetical protein KPH14_001814 [Odynerus spinipes]